MHVGQTRIVRALILGLLAAALTGCFSEVARRNDNEAAVLSAKQRALANETGSTGNATQPPPPTPTYQSRTVKTTAEQASSSSSSPNEKTYNIWDRIRAGLALPVPPNPQIQADIRWFEKRQKYLDRVVNRAQPYLHYIVEEIAKRHMPMDLALLPVVESAYQPFAYSPGHASGLWQFTPGTGRRFGLKQNWWYDGRRDVAESTRAALDYLQLLHDEFNGHWLEAIAAYNCGEANVQRAIEENKKAGKPTDFWHLSLPAETEGYVPRLLALAAIVARPSDYNLTLKFIPNRPYLASVDINGQVDLTKAARVAGMSPTTLFKLNPGFNRTVTGPHGSHSLLVPLDRAEKLAESVNQLKPSKIEHGWRRYTVHRGDTLSGIASRHHVSVAELRHKNGLGSNLIRAGHALLVPAPVPPGNPLLLAAGLPAAGELYRDSGSRKLTHVVRNGDSLWTIAHSYRVSVKSLCAWNRITPRSTLHPGQKLVIWRVERTASNEEYGRRHRARRLASAERSDHHASHRAGETAHVVRSGDSLWTIAKSYDVSVKQLCAWNGISPKSTLHLGQKLVIRSAERTASAGESSRPQRAQRLASAATPHHQASRRAAQIAHVVRSGESLWTIAKSYDVSVKQLCAWNGISRKSTLHLGQKLVIRRPGRGGPTVLAEADPGQFLNAATAASNGREHIRYQVRKGDSLWLISQRFSVTVAQLCKWNGLSKHDTLRPGQHLDVYIGGLRQTDASETTLAGAQGNQG